MMDTPEAPPLLLFGPVVIERTKSEAKAHVTGGPLVDMPVEFRGETVNIPFRPHVLVSGYDPKMSDEEILEELRRRMFRGLFQAVG
jgi:hypothetical protein